MPLFELCRDASLKRDSATGLPLEAMAAAYVANLRVASAAARGALVPGVGETPATTESVDAAPAKRQRAQQ